MSAVIEAHGITRRFGKVEALAGIDLVQESGSVLGVLGPNGAGKTTFVRAVATLLRPDSGTLRVAGFDVLRESARVRALIGLAGQSAAVEEALTGRENIEMVARLVGLSSPSARKAANEMLERFRLTEAADRLTRTYSGGMRRRLDIAVSMVGHPRLLLLDEPTTGLDPRSRAEVWEAVRQLVADGTDVLLTTHYLDEADHLATQLAVIDNGRVIASGTPSELKQRAGRDVLEVHLRSAADLPVLEPALAPLGGEPVIDAALARASVAVDRPTEALAAVVRALDAANVTLEEISVRRPTLDEVFLELTGAPRQQPDTAV